MLKLQSDHSGLTRKTLGLTVIIIMMRPTNVDEEPVNSIFVHMLKVPDFILSKPGTIIGTEGVARPAKRARVGEKEEEKYVNTDEHGFGHHGWTTSGSQELSI